MLIVLDFYKDFSSDFEPERAILNKITHKSDELERILVLMLVKDFNLHYNLKQIIALALARQESQLKIRSNTSLFGSFFGGIVATLLEIRTKIFTKIDNINHKL